MKNLAWPVVLYPFPKKAIFRVECKSGKYELPTGWRQVEEEYNVIGEDDTSYIYELRKSESKVLPLGVHKSRLVRFVSGQLQIDFYEEKH